MLTVAAICLGLTAIKLGFQGSHERAVQLILLACVLDGLDGRVARLFNSDSKMGAELDSLADFLNFGVAPPMVLYFWALQDMPRLGWISVQIFERIFKRITNNIFVKFFQKKNIYFFLVITKI